jgi:hypothetical protein
LSKSDLTKDRVFALVPDQKRGVVSLDGQKRSVRKLADRFVHYDVGVV